MWWATVHRVALSRIHLKQFNTQAHKPGDSEGQGCLACCSPWGHKELDMIGSDLALTHASSNDKVACTVLTPLQFSSVQSLSRV